MSSLIEGIKAKAKANKQHILLPEGEEERTIQAAAIIREQGLADLARNCTSTEEKNSGVESLIASPAVIATDILNFGIWFSRSLTEMKTEITLRLNIKI